MNQIEETLVPVTNGRIIRALLDFDFIVNTDIGVIRYIRDKYPEEKSFDLETLHKGDRYLLSLLYSRENSNPLSIIATDSDIINIDRLYTGLFKLWEESILRYSLVDDNILRFVRSLTVLNSGSGAIYDIVVSSEPQAKIMSKLIGSKVRLKKNLLPNDVLSYDNLYIRDYLFFEKYKILVDNIKGKTIYTTSRIYNLNYFSSHESLVRTNVVNIMEDIEFLKKGENDNVTT